MERQWWMKMSTFLHQFLALWSPWTNLRGKPWRPEVSQVLCAWLLWCSLDCMKDIDLPCHSPTKGLDPGSKEEEEASLSTFEWLLSPTLSWWRCWSCWSKGSRSMRWCVVFHLATVWKLPDWGKFKTLLCPDSQSRVPCWLTMMNLNSRWSPPLKWKSHTHPFGVQLNGTLVFHEPNCLDDPRRATCSPNWTWWSNRRWRWTLSLLVVLLFFPPILRIIYKIDR